MPEIVCSAASARLNITQANKQKQSKRTAHVEFASALGVGFAGVSEILAQRFASGRREVTATQLVQVLLREKSQQESRELIRVQFIGNQNRAHCEAVKKASITALAMAAKRKLAPCQVARRLGAGTQAESGAVCAAWRNLAWPGAPAHREADQNTPHHLLANEHRQR